MAIRSIAGTAVSPESLDFEEAVRQHQGMVFSVAYNFLRDRALAEELAQEVFLELHLNRRAIASKEHLRFWLRKVTGRRCIDQARRRRVRAQVGLEDAAEPFSWMAAEDPMLKRYIGHLVAALAEVPRLIVILRYQEDLTPTEIAEVLDMPIGTVKSTLNRALALLRRKVEAASLGDVK